MGCFVLGYNLRSSLADQTLEWTDERRSSFLIRPEILAPVSVDSDVWPAVSLIEDESHHLSLWGSASEVLAALPTSGPQAAASPVVIEIAVLEPDEDSIRYWRGIMYGYMDPEKDRHLKITPECLGYDVADRSFVSGLSNCMLSSEELASIRENWSVAVNQWGLFKQPEQANLFRKVCDRLIPEHAPFEAYRIRKVDVERYSA